MPLMCNLISSKWINKLDICSAFWEHYNPGKQVGTLCPILENMCPSSSTQCWSESCCQKPCLVFYHWLMEWGRMWWKGKSLLSVEQCLLCLSCEHVHNCNTLHQKMLCFYDSNKMYRHENFPSLTGIPFPQISVFSFFSLFWGILAPF